MSTLPWVIDTLSFLKVNGLKDVVTTEHQAVILRKRMRESEPVQKTQEEKKMEKVNPKKRARLGPSPTRHDLDNFAPMTTPSLEPTIFSGVGYTLVLDTQPEVPITQYLVSTALLRQLVYRYCHGVSVEVCMSDVVFSVFSEKDARVAITQFIKQSGPNELLIQSPDFVFAGLLHSQ